LEKDDLTEFLDWWLANKPTCPPNEHAIIQQGNTSGVVLYRNGQFQVELFIVQPNVEIVQHIHPNVDSYEVHLAGDINFYCDGILYNDGKPVRVTTNAWHGGFFGPQGGSFLSVQKWINGVSPKFVGDDWVDHSGNINYDRSTLTQGELNGNTNEKSSTNEETYEKDANEKGQVLNGN
jgi:quercetin dioxygenase-like cupin family protein